MENSRQIEIEHALEEAQAHLRRRGAFRVLGVLLPAGVALTGLIVALHRFTLMSLPPWVALIPVALTLIISWAWSPLNRISRSEAARYLDSEWTLDQRLSTLLQLQRRDAYSRSRLGAAPVSLLAEDTWFALQKARRPVSMLPKLRLARSSAVALMISCALLIFVLISDSPADTVRAEHASVERAVASQLQEIAALRADIEGKELPASLKLSLLAELDQLDATVRSVGNDRGALLAALGDAQNRIAGLTPERLSQWSEIIRASQAVQSMARRSVGWAPPPVGELGELTMGALASESIASAIEQVTVPIQAGMAQELDVLSRLVLAKSSTLSKAFESGSAALFGRDLDRARAAFSTISEELLRLEKRELTAETIDKALSKLEDGKQSLIEDQAPAKKAQVGFNRGDRNGGDDAAAPERADGGADVPANQEPGDDGTMTQPGQPGQPGERGMQGAGIGDGEAQQQEPGESSQGTRGSGEDDEGQPRTEGQGGEAGDTQSSQNGESRADSGQFEAPITGNPGSLTGGITKVENPTGKGLAPDESGQENGTSKQDRVYVPGAVEGAAPTGQGSEGREPESTGPSPVLPGVADDSQSTRRGDQGGRLTEVRTPYREVLREYAQRATEALENSYIPADAKKLVRDYFVGLDR